MTRRPTSARKPVPRPYFRDGEIQRICLEALRSVNFLPTYPQPVRIDRFIEKKYCVVPDYEDLPSGLVGLSQFLDGCVVRIVVARSLDRDGSVPAERRIRATLAHEAGHVLLHAALFDLDSQTAPLLGDWSDPARPTVLCREVDPVPLSSHRGGWAEYQANQAIAGLQLPRPLVDEVLHQFTTTTAMGLKKVDRAKTEIAVRALSETFDVNPVVARIHLENLFPSSADEQLALE